MIVRKSQRTRIPFSEALHRFAISAGVVLPSPIAVNTSSSIPVFKASVRMCALIVWKNNCGDGCGAAEVDMKIPFLICRNLYEPILPNWLAQNHLSHGCGHICGFRVTSTQTGDLQQRLPRARKHPEEITFFSASFADDFRPRRAGCPTHCSTGC